MVNSPPPLQTLALLWDRIHNFFGIKNNKKEDIVHMWAGKVNPSSVIKLKFTEIYRIHKSPRKEVLTPQYDNSSRLA